MHRVAIKLARRVTVAAIAWCLLASLFDALRSPSNSEPSIGSRRFLRLQRADRDLVYSWARKHLRPLAKAPEPTKETILFWHVPKSGGTTVKSVYECFGQTIANRLGSDAELPEDEEGLVVFRPWPWNSKAKYVNVDVTSRPGIDRAKQLGLVPSGLVDLVVTSDPAYAIEQLFDESRKGRALAMFRHPVDRLVSKYHYLGMAKWERRYEPRWKEMSLEQWAEEENNDNNHLVRKLSGRTGNDTLSDEDLRAAMRTIKQRFIVGLTNQMEESISRFNTVMGLGESHWRHRTCMNHFFGSGSSQKENVNPHPGLAEGSPAWQILARKNALDIRLYEYIVRIFDEQKDTIERYGPSIAWHNCPICNVLRFRTREEVAAHQVGCRGPMPLRIADLPLAERLQGRNGGGGGVGGGGTTAGASSIVGAAAAAAAAAGGNVPDPLAAAPDEARPDEAVAAGNTGGENEESDSSSSIEIIGVTKPPPKEEPPPTEAPVDSAPAEAASEKAAPDAEEETATEDAKDYVQVWTCDVCKEEQFEDYDEAVAHEASCTGPKRDLAEVDVDGSPAKPSQVVLFAPLLDRHIDSTNYMQISKYERLALKSVQLLYTPKPSGGELSFQCLHCATPLSPDGTDQTWTAGKIGTKVHAFACQHGRFCNAAPANERATLSNADASRRGKMALGAFLAGYFAENGIRENRRDGGGFIVMKDEDFRKVPGYELTKRGKQLQGGKKRRGKPTAKSPAKRPKGGKAELAPRSKHMDIRYGDMGCKMHSEEGAIFTLGPLDGLPFLCSFSREAAQKLHPSEKFLLQQMELFTLQPKHMESAKMDVSEPGAASPLLPEIPEIPADGGDCELDTEKRSCDGSAKANARRLANRLRRRRVTFGNPALGTYAGNIITFHPRSRRRRRLILGEDAPSASDGSCDDDSSESSDDTFSSCSSRESSLQEDAPEVDCKCIAVMVDVPPHQVPDGVLNLVRGHRPFVEHVRIVIGSSPQEEATERRRRREVKAEKDAQPMRRSRSQTWACENEAHHGDGVDIDLAKSFGAAASISKADDNDGIPLGKRESRSTSFDVPSRLSYGIGRGTGVEEEKDFEAGNDEREDKNYHILFVLDSEDSAKAFVEDLHYRPYTSLDESETCSVYHTAGVKGENGVKLLSPFFAPSTSASPNENAPSAKDEQQCPVCLEKMSLATKSDADSSSSILTTVCNHSFHIDCLSQWQDSPCPVCRYDHSGLNETLSRCHICSTTVRNYVCLICGAISCANGPLMPASIATGDGAEQAPQAPSHLGHARQHYEESLHAYALDTETQHVWDFAGGGYVHRLLQNAEDGKIVEAADPRLMEEERGFNLLDGTGASPLTSLERSAIPTYSSSAEDDEEIHRKLEGFAGQYYTLLKSQLEQQRIFYEGRLEAIRREHENKTRNEHQSTADVISALKQERNQLEQRCMTLRRKHKKVAEDTVFLENMNESLEADKRAFRTQIAEAQAELAEAKQTTQQLLTPLEEKVTQLMLQLEAGFASTAARAATARAGASRGFSVLTAAEEFPGIPSASPAPKKASSASVTTLPSGLTVVTEDASLTTTVALTYPNAGSSNEGPAEAGAALANRYLSFKSGSGLSSALILRNLEDAGASVFSSAGRRGATVGYTAARENAAFVAPLLVTECSFEKWDVKEAQELAGVEAVEATSNAQVALTDQIYAAAYGAQSSLGRSYYTAGASRPSIMSFREKAYSLNGAVLAATGVADHEAFVRMVEEEYPGAKDASEAAAAATAEYMGGEARVSAPSTGYAHVALAFQGPTSAPVTNVLKHCLALSGASPFAAPGVMGVYGGSAPADAAATVDALSKAVGAAPSADIVEKAKAAAKAEALLALDSGSKSLADAMTASILDSCGFSAAALAESYDGVSADQVSKAYSAMLKSKVSLAAVGDISSVPYHATIEKRFG
ncbi:hypothetical protein ACHAXT_006824 [Thalassiosira profunda]